VPRVIGQTVEAERKKVGSGTAEKQGDEASFFEDLWQRRGAKETEAAREILAWAKKCVLRIWWGKGKRDGSFYPMLHRGNVRDRLRPARGIRPTSPPIAANVDQ
jgi:hypothetical protein